MADTIKVSGSSVTTSVAGAIAGVMRHDHAADVQAIGPKAVNQAAKALAIARVYLQDDGLSICCVPQLVDVDVDGQTRTAVRFSVIELPEGVAP